METLILAELNRTEKALVSRGRSLVSQNGPWAGEIDRALNTVEHARRLDNRDLEFALLVLKTTADDATSSQCNNH